MMSPGATRRAWGLLMLKLGRAPSGGRSPGTMRPPAVTRRPGGLPCSLRSLSALPRLTEGEGDGRLVAVGGAVTGTTSGVISRGASGAAALGTNVRKLLSDLRPINCAEAVGRRTCSCRRVSDDVEKSAGKAGDGSLSDGEEKVAGGGKYASDPRRRSGWS
jgi:hypothetical protein